MVLAVAVAEYLDDAQTVPEAPRSLAVLVEPLNAGRDELGSAAANRVDPNVRLR